MDGREVVQHLLVRRELLGGLLYDRRLRLLLLLAALGVLAGLGLLGELE